MLVTDLEDAVWDVEGIRIVIRASTKSTRVMLAYNFKKAAPQTWTVSEWFENRVRPRTGSREVVVIGGDGEQPNGNMKLRTLRSSYSAS
jgi:hypothetical protein